ncbi:phage tail protein [Lactobacillus intestinalis]|uniref:phage tail protein n=1 Tax=Lactobacillus intestinalis TaxID=151781 RepID=UPI002729C694|nr:phage tail protein [Lactobacillus intestinalis]
MVLTIRSPAGVEQPIITQDVTISQSLGRLDTITVNFYDVNDSETDTTNGYNALKGNINNHPAAESVQPFSEIIENGQIYLLQDHKIDDSNDVPLVTLSGIQIAKTLHRQYINKVVKGDTYLKTEKKVDKIRQTTTISKPHKLKNGKTVYRDKKESKIITKKSDVQVKKTHQNIKLGKCLDFLNDQTKKLKIKYEKPDEEKELRNLEYPYPKGFGKGYADDLLKKLSKDYDFEYRWDNYTCIIAKKLGKKDAFYFVDQVNCQKINMEQNYGNITTRVTVKSNPVKTLSKAIKSTNKKTEAWKAKSHAKKEAYKKERKMKTQRDSYHKPRVTDKIISTTVDGKTQSKTKKSKSKIEYKFKFTYTSPMVKKAGWPIIDAKPKIYKENFTLDKLKALAKKLVHDAPLVTYTLTGSNFKQFGNTHGEAKIGNQGLIKQMGVKPVTGRISAITKYPEDDSKPDKITFGNFRTDPVLYQLRQRQEFKELQKKYDNFYADIFAMNSNFDNLLSMHDDMDSIVNNISNWHAKDYDRDQIRKKKLEVHSAKLINLNKRLEALEKGGGLKIQT